MERHSSERNPGLGTRWIAVYCWKDKLQGWVVSRLCGGTAFRQRPCGALWTSAGRSLSFSPGQLLKVTKRNREFALSVVMWRWWWEITRDNGRVHVCMRTHECVCVFVFTIEKEKRERTVKGCMCVYIHICVYMCVFVLKIKHLHVQRFIHMLNHLKLFADILL